MARLSGAAANKVRLSRRLRALAMQSAKHGSSIAEIARFAQCSIWLARQVQRAYRGQVLPKVVDGRVEIDGKVYHDLRALSPVLGISVPWIYSRVKRSNLVAVAGYNPKTGRITQCFDLKEVEAALANWGNRRRTLEQYRAKLRQWGVDKYSDLSHDEAVGLAALAVLLREFGGHSPSYQEIEETVGQKSFRAKWVIPALVAKGYISRIPVLTPRRGQSSFRYLIHRAPAKLVVRPIKCPDCNGTMWLPFDWYQPRRSNGNGAGK